MAIKNAGEHQMADETRCRRDPLCAKEIARALCGQALEAKPARFNTLGWPTEMNVNHHPGFFRCVPDRFINRVIVTAIFDCVGNLHCFEPQSGIFADILCRFCWIENEMSATPTKRLGSRLQNSWSQAL